MANNSKKTTLSCVKCGKKKTFIPCRLKGVSNVNEYRCQECYLDDMKKRKTSFFCVDCGSERRFSPSEIIGNCARYRINDGVYRCRKCWDVLRKGCRINPIVAVPCNCSDCGKAVSRNSKRCRDCNTALRRKKRDERNNKINAINMAIKNGEQLDEEQKEILEKIKKDSLVKSKSSGKKSPRIAVKCQGCFSERIISSKGRASLYCPQCRKGKNNPCWKGGLIELQCVVCKVIKTYRRNQRSFRHKANGDYHCMKCIGIKREGPLNAAWKGGKSFEPYPITWTPRLREGIRTRDNFVCQICHCSHTSRRMPVHHINYNKDDCSPDNLITLCGSCHAKTNFRRDFWEQLLLNIVKNRNDVNNKTT